MKSYFLAKKMAKSLRSKSRRKSRAILRNELYLPSARERAQRLHLKANETLEAGNTKDVIMEDVEELSQKDQKKN